MLSECYVAAIKPAACVHISYLPLPMCARRLLLYSLRHMCGAIPCVPMGLSIMQNKPFDINHFFGSLVIYK